MRTSVDRARKCVAHEREEVGAKHEAYDRFRSRIESISPRATDTGTGTGVGGNTLVSSGSRTTARPIRETFAETVAPTCENQPIMELLAAELGEEIGAALAAGGVSPPLVRAICTESDQRRIELAAMDRALDREAESLSHAAETIASICEWLIAENETPLLACGFEELRARHERLVGFRADCEALCADRQNHLERTTGADGQAGVRHRDLIRYLYEPMTIDHPVLVTVVHLDDLCSECQHAVRDHLVRRV